MQPIIFVYRKPRESRVVQFYAGKRLEIGAILRELCKWKGVNIIESEVCPDHVHMLLEIPPKMSILSFEVKSAFKTLKRKKCKIEKPEMKKVIINQGVQSINSEAFYG